MPVMGRVRRREEAALLGLPGQKNAIVGNKDVVEDHDADRLAILGGELGRRLAWTSRRARDDRDPGRVTAHGAAHGEVFVLGGVGPARHDEELVHIGRARDDGLCAANDDAVTAPFLDVNVDVRIDLLAGPLGAIALGIGHRDAERQILILNIVKIGEEALAVVCAVPVVGPPRRLVDAVECIVSEIALRASGRPANQADSLKLIKQVLRGLVDVEHPVDRFSGCALPRCHDRQVLLAQRKVVGDAHGGDARREQRLVGDARHAASVHEHPRLVGP